MLLKDIFLLITLLLSYLSIGNWAFAIENKSECETDLEASVKKVEKSVSLLKVANMKGDLKLATEREFALGGFLERCPKEVLPVVCGVECHYQRGRYYQFLAIASLYLPEVSSAESFDPGKSQGYADKGAGILEEGIKFLNIRKDSTLRAFTENLIKLQSVRIEIYILMGDFWYQTASQHALKKLDFAVNKVLHSDNKKTNTNWGMANLYYNIKALPAIIDSLTDIPDEQTYDTLRNTIKKHHYDVQLRIHSLQKGKLFLDLDPDEFTAIDFQSLKESLEKDIQKMKEIEDKIHMMSKGWFDSKTGANLRQMDEDRYQKGQSINLAIHTIGKMEAEAREHISALNLLKINIQDKSDLNRYHQKVRTLEVDLAKRVKEFEYKQKMIAMRKESDLIGVNKENHSDKRNEIRWLMNWKLSEMNLELQMNSFEAQFNEYDRQKNSNEEKLREIELSINQKDNNVEMNKMKIEEIDQKKNSLDKQQKEIFHFKQQILKEEICKIESELAYTGNFIENSPFRDDRTCVQNKEHYQTMNENKFLNIMCGGGEYGVGLKNLKNTSRITTVNELNSLTSEERKLLENISRNQTDSLERQVQFFKESLKKVNQEIENIKGCSDLSKWYSNLNSILSLVEAIAVAAPDVTLKIGGLDSGVSTMISSRAIASAISKQMEIATKWKFELENIKYSRDRDLIHMEQELISIQRQVGVILDEINAQKLSLKSQALENTLRSLSYKSEADLMTQENSILLIDCDHQKVSLTHRVNALKQDHKRLVLNYFMDAKQNDLIDFESKQLLLQKQQIALDINNVTMDQDKLILQRNHLLEDNGAIDELKDNIMANKSLVVKTKNNLGMMASESMNETSVLNSLIEQQKNYVMASEAHELEYAEQSIKNERSYFQEFSLFINEAKGYMEENSVLVKNIEESNRNISAFVGNEHKKIQDFIGKEDLFKANGENVSSKDFGDAILLSENEMEDFFKGIPDLVNSKKIISEFANHKLLLMKIKRRRLSDFNNDMGTTKPSFYRNSQQFDDDLREMDKDWIKANGYPVKKGFFTVVIPVASTFYQELLKKGMVQFEISENWSEQQMKRSGYKILGDENLSSISSVHLIDVLVATSINTEFRKSSHSMRVKYLGDGVSFESDYGSNTPYVYAGKTRSSDIMMLDSKDNIITQTISDWSKVIYPRNIEDRGLSALANDPGKALPLMGGPLLGKYEIKMNNRRGLGFSEIELTFIYFYENEN